MWTFSAKTRKVLGKRAPLVTLAPTPRPVTSARMKPGFDWLNPAKALSKELSSWLTW